MTEEKNTQDNRKGPIRRDFLKTSMLIGSGMVNIFLLKKYLQTKDGEQFVSDVMDGKAGKDSNIEIDDKGKKILDLYNEALEKSIDELKAPTEKEAARNLIAHRDIVFAASKEGYINLKITENKVDNQTKLLISHRPDWERDTLEISIAEGTSCNVELIKAISHEIEHAYQYVMAYEQAGFDLAKMDEFIENFHKDQNWELEAHMVGNIGAYLYARTHPKDAERGITTDPKQTGVDEIEFTGYWLNKKFFLPEMNAEDKEYRWFLERYSALIGVGIDILSGKSTPLLYTPTVRDDQLQQEFIEEASQYFVSSSWSEAIGLEMDPTEQNPLIFRHFDETSQ